MMKDLLLAIDQGTSGCKLTLFDIEGSVVSCVNKTYDTFYPQDNYVEQDCNTWWDVILEGIKEMIQIDHIDA